MAGHDSGIAPADEFFGHGLVVSGDEARRGGIGEHRRVRRNVGCAPRPQDQPLGLDDGTVQSGQRCAWFGWGHHGLVRLLKTFPADRTRAPSIGE